MTEETFDPFATDKGGYSASRVYKNEAEKNTEEVQVTAKIAPASVEMIKRVVADNDMYPTVKSFNDFVHDAIMHRLMYWLREWKPDVDKDPVLIDFIEMHSKGANASFDRERDALYIETVERSVRNIDNHLGDGERGIVEEGIAALIDAIPRLGHRVDLKRKMTEAIIRGQRALGVMTDEMQAQMDALLLAEVGGAPTQGSLSFDNESEDE